MQWKHKHFKYKNDIVRKIIGTYSNIQLDFEYFYVQYLAGLLSTRVLTNYAQNLLGH
jgi:hypothetical protein